MNKNDGGFAFPLPDDTNFLFPRMTLRDYFAAKAMQAGVDLTFTHPNYFEKRAEIAYRMADAMLAARGVA